jgi:ubiquinone/menaquinone biosynthesis C-methylase UbiE
MQPPDRYYTPLATAFVRGRLADPAASIEDGIAAGLRLHKFKNDTILPRVQRVLGILRGLAPESLLDVGSGRGTFLWPLLDAFPSLAVTSIDTSEQRVSDINAVHTGGIARVKAFQMNAEQTTFPAKSFDVVTLLEVLEHMPNPGAALHNAVSLARRFVVLSVPSVPDDNPEHIHLFTPEQITSMATDAGSSRTTIEHVLNHRIAVLRVQP